ncbi:hypothetical protein K2X96_01835 [Patescibacteria group bacterium]|nr:hypothetical protein [Patescibacteria group bacterium]
MNTNTNILYFLNGAIGDFLMVLFLMENIHKNNTGHRLYIITPRNVDFFKALLGAYPYIEVLEGNRNTVTTLALKFFLKRNICITPPTPGSLPLATKVIARLLSLRGSLIGFDDGRVINRALYTHLIPFNIDKLYCELILDILLPLGFQKKQDTPYLVHTPMPDVLKRLGLKKSEYIILHPFASSPIRSILGEELVALVDYIQRSAPHMRIVLSGSKQDTLQIPESLFQKTCVIAGDVSVPELATLIDSSKLYVGVDTGITHLASVLKAPSLVVAHNGASNWLPYYNENSIVIYQIKDDNSDVHDGRKYLESKREGRTRYLDRVPMDVIKKHLHSLLEA